MTEETKKKVEEVKEDIQTLADFVALGGVTPKRVVDQLNKNISQLVEDAQREQKEQFIKELDSLINGNVVNAGDKVFMFNDLPTIIYHLRELKSKLTNN